MLLIELFGFDFRSIKWSS